jgi:2,4-dienoyl-CoA reductase-like NADH-dependent reductase (Old Yellow Enzyme family)
MMADLPFTPFRIGALEIRNRFMMSAAVDGLAHDIGARVRRYAALAEGGVGLIVAGRVLSRNESFEKVVEAVHQAGGRIALQILSHRGLGFDPSADAPAASVVERENPIFSDVFPYSANHEATASEIDGMVGEFVFAARLAKSVGVDAVQVHSAHNSALMQYLTPLINRRTDAWGGTIESRVRIHREVYRAVRGEVGNAMPILIKLGVADVFPGGLALEDGVRAAQILAKEGYDAIEVSQGLQDFRDVKTLMGTPLRSGIVKPSQEAYFRSWCAEVKRAIGTTTITTGGIRSYELVSYELVLEILASCEADMIGMCRPFIREPGLVKRWEGGDRKKATCISCNKCGTGLMKGLPLACPLP